MKIDIDLYDVIIDKKNQVALDRQLNDSEDELPDTISLEQLLSGVNKIKKRSIDTDKHTVYNSGAIGIANFEKISNTVYFI